MCNDKFGFMLQFFFIIRYKNIVVKNRNARIRYCACTDQLFVGGPHWTCLKGATTYGRHGINRNVVKKQLVTTDERLLFYRELVLK